MKDENSFPSTAALYQYVPDYSNTSKRMYSRSYLGEVGLIGEIPSIDMTFGMYQGIENPLLFAIINSLPHKQRIPERVIERGIKQDFLYVANEFIDNNQKLESHIVYQYAFAAPLAMKGAISIGQISAIDESFTAEMQRECHDAYVRIFKVISTISH